MAQRGKTGVVRISRSEVSGRVAREEQASSLLKVPSGLLVAVHGVDAGDRFELHEHSLVLGRGSDADLHVSDPATSEAHAKLTFELGQWVLHDLGTPSGTFVNDERVAEYVLRDGDRIRIGRTILKLLTSGDLEKRAIDELFRVQHLDGLTLASNNETFSHMLVRDVAHARRYGRSLSLIWMDVDGFRRLNEAHGEPVGNQVLQRLTTRLRGLLRKQDFLARVSDDEFAILLPATGAEEAEQVAAKLRHTVEQEQVKTSAGTVQVTVSGGVSTLSGIESGHVLMERTRDAMIEAQRSGGNRVLVRRPENLEPPRPNPNEALEDLDDEDE